MKSRHELIFHHHTESVSTRYAELIIDTFQSILQNIIYHPKRQIRDNAILGPLNKGQIFDAISVALPFTQDFTIPLILGLQSLLRGSSPAIASAHTNLTYEELDRLTSRLARHLHSQGLAGPSRRIALCFEKSPWAIVALLAVLKAGSAFILLDVASPRERLATIVQVSGACAVLCSEQQYALSCSIIDAGDTAKVVITDGTCIESLLLEEPADTWIPGHIVRPEDEAYIIFTSGTTGTPKGIVVEHGVFSIGAVTHGKAMLLDATSRVLQFASYSFDACLVEILTTLIHGGCVCPCALRTRPGY